VTARKTTPKAVIARALAEADREKDAAIAKRYGVKAATIRTWRRRAADDPDLAALVDVARRRAVEQWRPEAAATMISLLTEMRRLVRAGRPIPFELIGAVKVVGALNIEAGALLGEVDPAGERWPDPKTTPVGARSEAQH